MTPTPKELALIVRARRGDRSLREAAKLIGVSAATLQRIEAAHDITLSAYRKVEKWLTA